MRGRNPDNPSDRTSGVHTEQRIEISKEPDISNALMSVNKDSMVMETKKIKINKVGQISSDGSQCGTVVDEDGLYPTVSAGTHGYANPHIQTRYRIRKLTARECWRLMDFSDEDFAKAEAVNSNTKLYQQAGNAIVKNVLVAVFGQMFVGKENIYKERVAGAIA